jgi:hypothetical protein
MQMLIRADRRANITGIRAHAAFIRALERSGSARGETL